VKIRSVRFRKLALVLSGLALATSGLSPRASMGATRAFDDERRAGTPYRHQSNWEPTVATDPSNPDLVYQLITGISARECEPRCPGTSVLFRKSEDGGATWGSQRFVCGLACKGVGWQFDPQIKVATDGTIYVAFMNEYDPGVVLFTSSNRGTTWTGPTTMNDGLRYMDKPVLVISPTGRDVYVSFNGKYATYVVASHDYGQTFLRPTRTNGIDHVWWYSDGGTIAPDGSVYFALNGETGKHLEGPVYISVLRCTPSARVSCANPTWTTLDTSAPAPPCHVFQCYQDYYAATPSIASDTSGHLVAAYTFGAVDHGPKRLYTRTSDDGVTWSARTLANSKGDSNVPQIAAGPGSGDFRLAWQDDRTGAFNTWYSASSDGGSTWGARVKLSNLTSGAPYKSKKGYTFTDGDYFGIAVSSAGVTFAIWGEADGSSLYCCGDVWFTKGT